MAKVTINGEVFAYDGGRKPLADCLAIERALKVPYAQVEAGLAEGRADSLAAFMWLVWQQNGRDVSLADLLDGKVAVDMGAFRVDPEEGETDPTNPTDGPSSTTGDGTSASSLSGSVSVRGKSASST